MERITIGVIEARFADFIWEKAPVTTKELIQIGEKEFNWKKSTTYTVLRRLCDRGWFVTKDSVVTPCISREDFYSIQSEQFVETSFNGSLPEFFAAFSRRKKPNADEIDTLHRMIDAWGGLLDE